MDRAGKLRIGTAGWAYKDWVGIFYPDYLPARKMHPLEYLAQFFDVVEINTSFYGPIKPHLAKVWCKKVSAVNANFVFTAKLLRSFTHSPLSVMEPTSAATIRPGEDDEEETREGLDAIASEGRLGALLMQFPVSFKNTPLNREYVEVLLRQFIEYPRVIEVRHESWNNAETLNYFAQMNVAFCNIDQPQIGRSLAPTEHVTASISYIRLHGRNYDQWFDSTNRNERYNYLYSEAELRPWKNKIEAVANQTEVTYVVTNNHFEARAGVNALQLKSMLTGQRVKAPRDLLGRYPELKDMADPAEDEADPNLSLLA